MKFGASIVLTDRTIALGVLAQGLEERGFDTLWLPDHSHEPLDRVRVSVSRRADDHRYGLEPLSALAAVSSVTKTLRLATGVLLLAERDLLTTAKTLATIDHLSNGRLRVGIGFGWNSDEMADHGADFANRREITREYVAAMRRLWDRDASASFHGNHVNLLPSAMWPKPVQERIPVLLGGGYGPKLLRHLAEYADGWIAVGGRAVREGVSAVRNALEDVGRDPDEAEIVCFSSPEPDPAKLAHMAALGVSDFAFDIPPMAPSDVLRLVDRQAAAIEQYEAG
jgi:probable F420-dependent oxidoreductase